MTDELCTEIDKIAPNYVFVTTVPNFLDVRFFIWKKYREHLNMTYVIDLEKPLDKIWASFSKRCRQEIKYVSACSPEIQQTNDTSPLLDIWRGRFSKRGLKVPLLSDNYLKELVAAFPQDVTVYNVSIDGKLATATACCVMQKERYGYWIGNVNECEDLSVADYLVWEVVQRAKSKGFKKLDLGGGLENLSKFKSKFNPVLEPYFSVDKRDTVGKIHDFTYKKLSRAKKLASYVLPRGHL